VLLLTTVVLAGCAGSESERSDGSASTTSTTTATSSTTVASGSSNDTAPTESPGLEGCPDPVDGDPATPGPYAVGRSAVTFIDPSRPTEPSAESTRRYQSGRALPVIVLYPAEGAPGDPGEFADGAPGAPGAFPLVVYSHGVAATGTERNDALARWARAGYVVVAPTFPLSSEGMVGVPDLRNQPGDLRFVVESLRSSVQEPGHPLAERVLFDCLALAGHSLGGATTLAASFDPCCAQLDPAAVVEIGGFRPSVTPDADYSDAAPVPVLVVHGAQDATIRYELAEQVLDAVPGPAWLLTFPAGGHNSMFLPPEVDVLTDAVVSFLDAELKGATASFDELSDRVDASGIATLRAAPAN
jgi:pimeloyl-ACP methyl ester carboxylesterase